MERNRTTETITNATLPSASSIASYSTTTGAKSGVPRGGDNPFNVPNTNTKANSTRYLQATQVLRQYIAQTLPTTPLLELLFSRLFGFLDTQFNRNQKNFATILPLLGNWFKIYVLTGKRDRGDIPRAYWSEKLNCPTCLEHIMTYYAGSKDDIVRKKITRIILSMFMLHKVITVPVAPTLASITDPFKGIDLNGSFLNFKEIFAFMGIDTTEAREVFAKRCAENTFHESMSAGPNGSATWAAHLDAYEIASDHGLMGVIGRFCNITGMKFVQQQIMKILGVFQTIDVGSMDYTGGCHSKLHVLYEKGTKSRIIAIGDYFTQTLLGPVHDMLATILRAYGMDVTFNQEKGFNDLLWITKDQKQVYSYDLSKATDRLPIAAQTRMMAAILGDQQLANLWADLLTKREFHTENGHKVVYKVGQPMGFKSSFPSMALFHHCVVIQAAINVKRTEFTNYRVLGDDVVIVGEDVALEYARLMGLLGVDISPTKSITPGEGAVTGFEFCSRIGLAGEELTGLPLRGIVEVIRDSASVVSLWDVLQSRAFFKGQEIWSFLSIFLSEKDLKFLFLLNALPSMCSGINKPVPITGVPGLAPSEVESWGFSMIDIQNFYIFNLITEIMSKVDSAVKRVSNLTQIVDSEMKTRPSDQDVFLSGTPTSLSLLVNAQAKQHNEIPNDLHPIQSVVRQVGSKVLLLLNMFSGSSVNINELLSSPLLSILSFNFNQKASYAEKANAPLGDRRVLEKTLRQLFKRANNPDNKGISYTGSIEGVTHLWICKVEIGKPLVVTPHVPKLATISAGGIERLRKASNTFNVKDMVTF